LAAGVPSPTDDPGGLIGLHPLLWYDPEAEETLFLNARRGRSCSELLSYKTGRTADRVDEGAAQQALLDRLLGAPVSLGDLATWNDRSRAEELAPPETAE